MLIGFDFFGGQASIASPVYPSGLNRGFIAERVIQISRLCVLWIDRKYPRALYSAHPGSNFRLTR